jgi:hypothetical protein
MLQLDNAVVRDHAREQIAHAFTDGFQIEVLQSAVAGVMEKYHDEHHFRP